MGVLARRKLEEEAPLRPAAHRRPPGRERIGDCFDNSVVESSFWMLQLELLDEHRWDIRALRDL